ncbi:hypothetical protein IFO70_33360 [Phormidium tenue FACHB-886]|nr:hypothetical protein [Phormidium tenue FACHB-886]
MTTTKTAPLVETDLLKRLENLEAELEHAFDQIGRLKRSAPLGFGFGKVVQLWVVPDASNGRLSFCLDKTGRQSLPFTSLAGTLRLANFPDRGNLGASLELDCSSWAHPMVGGGLAGTLEISLAALVPKDAISLGSPKAQMHPFELHCAT